METQVKDDTWKSLLKQIFPLCSKEMGAKVDETQKRLNVTTEQCNVKYDLTCVCVNFQSLLVGFIIATSNIESLIIFQYLQSCPKNSWNDKAECTDFKNVLINCHDNKDFMEKIFRSRKH